MKLKKASLPYLGRKSRKPVLILGEEVVPSPETGDIFGYKIVLLEDESSFWIAEDRALGSSLVEGYYTLDGVRSEVQRRQSELDALRRATGDAERTHAAFLEYRESKKDGFASKRKAGSLPRVRSWLVE